MVLTFKEILKIRVQCVLKSGVTTFRINYCLAAGFHCINVFWKNFDWNVIPGRLQIHPQRIFWGVAHFADFRINVIPNLFNWVKVGTLWWPNHTDDFTFIKKNIIFYEAEIINITNYTPAFSFLSKYPLQSLDACLGSLSSWKVNPLPKSLFPPGRTCLIKIWWYTWK